MQSVKTRARRVVQYGLELKLHLIYGNISATTKLPLLDGSSADSSSITRFSATNSDCTSQFSLKVDEDIL